PPDRFAQQLRYLRDSGFRTVSLGEWRRAKDTWTPLPGRCVMLTFDDGFRDFASNAWPLLRRYGFDATLFVPTAYVGSANVWHASYGESPPLLTWDQLRTIRGEGVVIGSHSVTHPMMTALTPNEIVREAARSRTTLERELGAPVTSLAYPHGAEDPAVH